MNCLTSCKIKEYINKRYNLGIQNLCDFHYETTERSKV